MIVALAYQFHDYGVEALIIDTSKLDQNNIFQRDVKNTLELKNEKSVTLEGIEEYDGGDLTSAVVKPPATVEKTMYLHVSYDI